MQLITVFIGILCFPVFTNSITIDKNGYKNIVISFSEKVLQQAIDFEKLQNVLRNASEYLFSATRKRSYFEEFVLVVPSTWTTNEVCQHFITEVPKTVDIYFTGSSESNGLKVQHSKECGEPGEVMYIPNVWLRGDSDTLARQFLQQWSTLRYGVFSETPERPKDCFLKNDGSWSPTGCYNVKLDEELEIDENGLPVCNLPDGFLQKEDLKSSIMFTSESSKVSDYCDGLDFPHNRIEPTPHNRLCNGQDVWSVIRNTEDFIFGRNSSLNVDKPPKNPVLSCYKETGTEVAFAIQNGYLEGSENSQALIEMRYSLYRFLSNMVPIDSNVHLVTFAGTSEADATQPIKLNLKNTTQLEMALDTYLRQKGTLQEVCITCGLKKILQIPGLQHPVIVLIAWQSSLNKENASAWNKILATSPNAVFHLILVEDSTEGAGFSELLDVVRNKSGKVFKLKTNLVLMNVEFNIALVEAIKNPLHIEDKVFVVHKAVYANITSNLYDSYVIPKGDKGRLLYLTQCENLDDMKNLDATCEDWKKNSYTFKCGKEYDLEKYTKEFWSYSYFYQGHSPIMCASLAMLRTSTPGLDSTVRGWLNKNEVIPGPEGLVIYAEVLTKREFQVNVEALISGTEPENSFRLQLRDNGNGDPDVIKGDGIFSRYFTSYEKKGTYIVSLNVEITPSSEYGETNPGHKVKQQFTKIIDFFKVLKDPPEEDIFPPNRVADLTLVSVDHENCTATLQWTAPGGNLDSGRATNYDIRVAKHWSNLLDKSFNDESNIQLPSPTPSNSGIIENVTVNLPTEGYRPLYFLALRAMNHNQYSSFVSNTIQIFLKGKTTSSSTTGSKSEVTITSTVPNTETDVSVTEIPENENTTSSINDNMTLTTCNENGTDVTPLNPDDYIKKSFVIMLTSSVGGGILLLILIINTIICCYCFRRSRKKSLSTPSQSNYGLENNACDTFETDRNYSFPSPYRQNRSESYEYSYHTNKSLEKENNSEELGFRLVQAMPTFVSNTSSLRSENEGEEIELKSRITQPQKLPNTNGTHIYHLGKV